MSHAYARAYVLRESTEGKGPIRFVAATSGKKPDGIDLKMEGAQLDRFRSNPVILYTHQSWGRDSLPIGRASDTEVGGDRLMMDVEFDQADDFAVKVERKYRDGFMSAVSIRFDVLKWATPKDNYWTGGTALEWELLETSAVPVPLDANALVESGRGLFDDGDALIRNLIAEFGLERVMRALQDPFGAKAPDSRPPRVADVVNQDAVREIHAALTLSGGK